MSIVNFLLPLHPHQGGYGVIGSHARLRIWCREAWGFESLYPHFNRAEKSARFSFDKGSRSIGGGVVVLSALVECAELLRNFGTSFEKYLLKQVWRLFSINLPNLRFFCTFLHSCTTQTCDNRSSPVDVISIICHDIALLLRTSDCLQTVACAFDKGSRSACHASAVAVRV